MKRLTRSLIMPLIAVTAQLPGAASAADLPARVLPGSAISTVIASPPSILGTSAIPIRAERFEDSLRRAHEDASASPALQRLIAPARRLPPPQQLAFVQHAVSTGIQWASDTTQWGQHDYWASAAQTLARGAGDMEDRAIVKMQALRALGFNSGDLFLTLARDRVAGAETVLTVRLGGRYYVLDDSGGTPYLAEERRAEFQPLISFGWNQTWVHMQRAAAPPAAVGMAFARK
jgi:predicted transglutaminase-like cysteine proteinase